MQAYQLARSLAHPGCLPTSGLIGGWAAEALLHPEQEKEQEARGWGGGAGRRGQQGQTACPASLVQWHAGLGGGSSLASRWPDTPLPHPGELASSTPPKCRGCRSPSGPASCFQPIVALAGEARNQTWDPSNLFSDSLRLWIFGRGLLVGLYLKRSNDFAVFHNLSHQLAWHPAHTLPFGTQAESLTFTVVQPPRHGLIEHSSDGHRSRQAQVFTMEDVYQNRISYSHDGSNSLKDRFAFSVSDGTNPFFVVVEEDGKEVGGTEKEKEI